MTFHKSISARTQFIKASLLAVAAAGFAFMEASPVQSSISSPADMLPRADATLVAATSAVDQAVLEDGDYLFGQSPQPWVNGVAYAVFSVQDNQTVGAFYQPNSSFDCFYGSVQPDRLALNVVDSYEQTVHPYEVALTLDNSLVAGGGAGAYTLAGFHRLDSLSAQDIEMLAVCKADFAE